VYLPLVAALKLRCVYHMIRTGQYDGRTMKLFAALRPPVDACGLTKSSFNLHALFRQNEQRRGPPIKAQACGASGSCQHVYFKLNFVC